VLIASDGKKYRPGDLNAVFYVHAHNPRGHLLFVACVGVCGIRVEEECLFGQHLIRTPLQTPLGPTEYAPMNTEACGKYLISS
jgi:hypothetical protein